MDILRLSAATNAQTALALGVKLQTIKNTRTEIYRRLGIHGNNNKKIRALTKALRLGIVSIGDLVSGDSGIL